MGQTLSQPVRKKKTEVGEDKYLAYGLSCMQGWRINMEDSHTTILNINDSENHVSFFGVYDGHGGEKSAFFAGQHLHDLILSTELFKRQEFDDALKEGFLACDVEILNNALMKEDDSGCAATSTIITPEKIFCGNAGDSRTIMSVDGYAKALSFDHKPSNEGEKIRICSAGGYVDMNRVNGNLALSRGIGDFDFKKNSDLPAEEQIVTAYPDVIEHNIDYECDEFIVLACDGIWDCLTSQNCVECIRRGVYLKKALPEICEDIIELCCAPNSDGVGIGCDNMSLIIIALLDYKKNETLDQWYEKINKKIEYSIMNNDDFKYGMISNSYDEIHKEMYGSCYEIGKHLQSIKNINSSSLFGEINSSQSEDSDSINLINDSSNDEISDNSDESKSISIQKLLSSNHSTNENNVIYLNSSSVQSLLASIGISNLSKDKNSDSNIDSESTDQKIDPVEDNIDFSMNNDSHKFTDEKSFDNDEIIDSDIKKV